MENDVLLTDEERSLLIKLAGRFETLAEFWRTPSGSSEPLADECERDCDTLRGLIERTAKQEPKWLRNGALHRLMERLMTSEWISVSERLPKADADVLLTDGEEVVQAWFEEDDGWQAWHTSDNWRGAQAWMPMPKPPRK